MTLCFYLHNLFLTKSKSFWYLNIIIVCLKYINFHLPINLMYIRTSIFRVDISVCDASPISLPPSGCLWSTWTRTASMTSSTLTGSSSARQSRSQSQTQTQT